MSKKINEEEERYCDVTVHHCARCGRDHVNLRFKYFIGTPIEDHNGTAWGLWAACPVTGDPILLRVTLDEKSIKKDDQSG